MSQTVMFPLLCLGCKQQLIGIQEGIAVYECGTMLGIFKGRCHIRRSQDCIEAPRISPGNGAVDTTEEVAGGSAK